MSDEVPRFYIPTQPTLIETFRAFRAHLEKMAAQRGEALDPAWYRDSPQDVPGLYKDQPHLLEPD